MLKYVKTLAYNKEKVYICDVKIKKICLTVPRGTLKLKVMKNIIIIRLMTEIGEGTINLKTVNIDGIKRYLSMREIDFAIDRHSFGIVSKNFYSELIITIDSDRIADRDNLQNFIICLKLNYPNLDVTMF